MGYSCTQDADNMLGLIRHTFTDGQTSNGLKIGARTYFYEVGREQADGHITGTLMENVGENLARPAGRFTISANGAIVAFPRLKSGQKISLAFKFAELKRVNPSLLRSYSQGVI